jgi:uncharacterized membrane protein
VTDGRLRLLAIVLALAGIGVAGYLTYVHFDGAEPLCGLGGDCEKVQTSDYARLAGAPVALLGLISYVLILGSLVADRGHGRLAALVLALSGFGFSAYLTYRELFTIEAICPWCVASQVILALLAVVTTMRFLREDSGVSRSPHAL